MTGIEQKMTGSTYPGRNASSMKIVAQAALVAAPRGVADDDGQDVEAEVVVVRPPDGTADQEAAIAAAEGEDDGRLQQDGQEGSEPGGYQSDPDRADGGLGDL